MDRHVSRTWPRRLTQLGVMAAVMTACSSSAPPAGPEAEVRLVLAGQALIKKDPRIRWEDPFGSLRPILERADVAFTNFEMAVLADQTGAVSPPTTRSPSGGPASLPRVDPGTPEAPTPWPRR